MVTKLFDYHEIKKSENFCVKDYKDSYYVG